MQRQNDDYQTNELDSFPHQINAPVMDGNKRQSTFVNPYGVTIGDSYYDSMNSPLNHWSEEIDPAVMAGPEWVHETNDIGWNTSFNRKLMEENYVAKRKNFSHPTHDSAYRTD
ncbi:DUF3905 domain-containing protein [Thalassobacillus pellis]|uniref:DUF3905 domain-containing protein n=1 Tax=Thalassobacillus pellis TaxID=748008 RepID=UPI0019608DD7|nr:DUF3905 domain-containing protein [Thalassobacillus pellis]MBM7552985.1 hypothetical protein [Thalassobacillus pellis]